MIMAVRPATGHIRRIDGFGNSHLEGEATLGDRTSRFLRLAADSLGATESNYSKGGSVSNRHSDTGGWRAHLKRQKPLNLDGTVKVSGPPSVSNEVTVLCRNTNELLIYGPTKPLALDEVVRCSIARPRCCYLFGADAAGWTKSGAGATSADSGTTDGPYQLMTAGQYVERTMGADWPGGKCHFGFVAGGEGAFRFGGQFNISVDGVVVLAVDLTNIITSALGNFYLSAVRRFDVPAGAVVRLTCTGVTGADFAAYNYFGCEAPSPGLTVAIGGYRLTQAGIDAYTFYGNEAGVPWIADVNVVDQNTRIQAVVAEFTSRETYFDLDAIINKQASMIDASDNLHPSQYANLKVGSALAKHIRSRFPDPWSDRPRVTPVYTKIVDTDGYTGGGTYGTGIVEPAFGFAPPSFRRDPDGTVTLRGLLQRTTGPGNGVSSTLCTLPPGFRPEGSEAFLTHGSDGTTRTSSFVSVSNLGVISVVPPSAGTAHPAGASSFIALTGISFKAAR